ncbi:MAG: hypothetical protein WED15_05390 [Akkermansiaceae bacterium]
MKFPNVLIATGACAWTWTVAGAPELPREPAPPVAVAEKPLESLIEDLGHEQYKTREAASRRIWALGDPALPMLKQAAAGDDPEMSHRARDLIRKIQLHITPDTDASVLLLVERYAKASAEEKIGLYDEMHKKRAWRQILKLFAAETNAELKARLQVSIGAVAVVAARERLHKADVEGAREFLEMAPADAAGLLALADFHRNQGTLDAELERAKTLDDAQSRAWRLALHRAAGNLDEARKLAAAAGDKRLAAAMSMLQGDPLPWLDRGEAAQRKESIYKTYTELAIKRWQGQVLRPAELASLVRAAQSRNPSERARGINALFLLGETKLAEDAYVKASPLAGFYYFEPTERVPEALEALGLNPENPDYAEWINQRLHLLRNDANEDADPAADGDGPDAITELGVIASFIERRGLSEISRTALFQPIIALSERNVGIFTDLINSLFGNTEVTTGAPQLARDLAIHWAGDDDERWLTVTDTAFGGQDDLMAIWDWMAELDAKASRGERLDGLLAICGMIPDPRQLREKWLALGWAAYERAPEDKRMQLLENLTLFNSRTGDVATSMKILDLAPEEARKGAFWRTRIMDLSAAERWEDAAGIFLTQIDQLTTINRDPQPALHACAAASLRRAGREEEAETHDQWVETLALGHDALEIANGYAFGYDYPRAAEWYARATRQLDPESVNFSDALKLHLDMLLEQRKWKEVASVGEGLAHIAASGVGSDGTTSLTKFRLQADMGKALAMLKTDRSRALAILDDCYLRSSGDGFMADYFFPSVREMGLIEEHDKWFNTSWDWMVTVIGRFPESDNTYNSAGWLASRACRQLDQAEGFLKKALAMNPHQAAYLDTMAEIQFAKGKREKALEWSTVAMNYRPGDLMLRRQHERFRSAPIPRR